MILFLSVNVQSINYNLEDFIVKKQLTLFIVAIICILWAIPIPGLDPIPVLVDDFAAAVGGAVAIYKLIQSFFQTNP